MDILTLALGALIALPILKYLLTWWEKNSMISRIPGPVGLPILGNFLEIRKFNYDLAKIINFWTSQYKFIFQVKFGSRRIVFLGKPEDIEIVLSSNVHITKSKNYKNFYEWIGDGLLTSTGQKWKQRRKMLTPGFHFSILDQFVEVFNRNDDILVEKLSKEKGECDVFKHINLLSLDIICETAMGTSVHAQKQSDSNYVKAVGNACLSMNRRTLIPWLQSQTIFDLSDYGKTFKSSVASMHKYTKSVIESRRKERQQQGNSNQIIEDDVGKKRRVAFLDLLLDANDASGANMTDKDILDEVETFMFEGHDTTSAGMAFTLYTLAGHPEVQEKLYEEMQDIFDGSNRHPTTQDLHNMRYLDRVIKESLRLYPSVPQYGRTVVMEDLELTDGVVLPKGTDITVNCNMAHRNPRHWPDPDRFDPDRFLPENTQGRHPFAYVPFSAGARNCIGQKFAMLEMKATVSAVVRNFKLSLPHPDYTPEVKNIVILRAWDGVRLVIQPRNST